MLKIGISSTQLGEIWKLTFKHLVIILLKIVIGALKSSKTILTTFDVTVKVKTLF